MYALDISHFTKRYGKEIAVDDISFSVKPGEFFGFLGPNGAGKTTTINCITGISTVSQGTIKVFDIDVTRNYRDARKRIGLSAQEFNVDIWATTYKILWYVAGYFGMPKKQRNARIEEMLHIFELTEYRNKSFRELSGGLKRRVMLARAMIHNPDLFILDEPTAGVDIELRHELWHYLKLLNKQGKTIILTSHYLEEVEQLCNRIAFISKGKIVAIGDKSEFMSNGQTLEQKYLEITKKKI